MKKIYIFYPKFKTFFFWVGSLYNHSSSKNSLNYIVKSFNDLQLIIDHFYNFTLINSKLIKEGFVKIVFVIFINKDKLYIEVIEKWVAMKS